MTLAEKLDSAIKAVCPIQGVSIGRMNDKTTWRIDFKDEATAGQRTAAAQVLANFVEPPDALPEPDAQAILRALVKKGLITEADARAEIGK